MSQQLVHQDAITRLADIEGAGVATYHHTFARTHSAAQVAEAFGQLAKGKEVPEPVRVAGRVGGSGTMGA
jgi:lysyl-tRNA synthetase class II